MRRSELWLAGKHVNNPRPFTFLLLVACSLNQLTRILNHLAEQFSQPPSCRFVFSSPSSSAFPKLSLVNPCATLTLTFALADILPWRYILYIVETPTAGRSNPFSFQHCGICFYFYGLGIELRLDAAPLFLFSSLITNTHKVITCSLPLKGSLRSLILREYCNIYSLRKYYGNLWNICGYSKDILWNEFKMFFFICDHFKGYFPDFLGLHLQFSYGYYLSNEIFIWRRVRDLHCSLHVPGIQLRVDSNLNSKWAGAGPKCLGFRA